MRRSRADEILASTTGPSVLHLGCLGGLQHEAPPLGHPQWLHRRLLDRYPDVWGIDLDEGRIEVARQAGVPNLVSGDVQDFDMGRTFDTVVAGELIEHVGNPAGLLRQAARHLTPAGRIVLTTPYGPGLVNVLYAWMKYPKTCSNPEHTMWFCRSTLSTLAEQNGLAVVAWRLIDHYPVRGWGKYALFGKAMTTVGRILPRQVRCNNMLAVLQLAEGSDRLVHTPSTTARRAVQRRSTPDRSKGTEAAVVGGEGLEPPTSSV